MQGKKERVFIKRKELRKMLYKKEWFYNFELVIIICFIFYFVNMFLFNIAAVKGVSMMPTLKDGDLLLVSNTFYNVDNGDIIIAKKQDFKQAIIKRVIAKEGQTIDIDFVKGDVFVDGKLLKEDYIDEKTLVEGNIKEEDYPLTVPKDSYFVMGDNRNESIDSRYNQIGMIHKKDILGEVMFKIWG